MPRVSVPAPNRHKIGENYTQLSLSINTEWISEIDKLAARFDGNRSSIARQAIAEFIERNKLEKQDA
jgi:predicted transcriptional regulator